jgi:DnaA-homolog protein
VSEQLTLGVSLHEESTFDNFYPGQNAQLITALRASAQARGERYIYFWGAGHIGRTHLLQASCHKANQFGLASMYLPMKEIVKKAKPDMFQGLESLKLICIDDIQVIAGRPAWEEAFFHFYNVVREKKRRLIVAANGAPKSLGLALDDLVSRLAWGLVYSFIPLTDDEKLSVLRTRSLSRGFDLPSNVAAFLLRHFPRDMGSLFSALEKLDQVSLVEKRKLTIPFLKQVLGI